jgi:predicted ester cyclase
MSETDLAAIYRDYIGCLNRQDWAELGRYVAEDVTHNGRPFGLSGYRQMLEQNFRDIPDLQFNIAFVVSEPPVIGSRLTFDCTPVGRFLDLAIDGRRVSFTENVFYRFRDGRIVEVWSVVDKAAIEAQLLPGTPARSPCRPSCCRPAAALSSRPAPCGMVGSLQLFRSGLMRLANSSNEVSPLSISPLMKKVGVEFTFRTSLAYFWSAAILSSSA